MSRVIRLDHEGVPCALPAEQIHRATREQHRGAVLSLFGRPDSTYETRLAVETASGTAWLPCISPHMSEVPRDTMRELPPLLKSVLDRAWIVGCAPAAESLVWLVDVSRCDSRAWVGA